MNRFKINLLTLLITIFTLFNASTTIVQAEDFSVPAKAAIAVDFETGKILYEQNIDTPLGIASMTKLISAYLVYQALDEGSISLNDPVPYDDALIKKTEDWTLSNIPIDKNLTYTVEDNIKAMLISSSNTSTTALARMISKTEQQFVDDMRALLKKWEIDDAHIISASGLSTGDLVDIDRYPNSDKDDENLLSARDMVIVARHLITDYPQVLDITKEPTYTLFAGTPNEVTYESSNLMLPGLEFETPGVDGLKTGTAVLAGACFIGSIEKDGRRTITVVMDVDDTHSRFEATKMLMDYVFDTWKYDVLLHQGDRAVIPAMTVPNGVETTVDLIIEEDVSGWVKDGSSDTTQTFNSDYPNDTINAPIKAGTVVGNETIINTPDNSGYLTKEDSHHAEQTVKVIAKKDIEKANIFTLIWRKIKNSIS